MTDVGPLAALTGLQSLNLMDTQVRDVGPLAALTGLKSLDLWGHAGARRGAPGRPHRPQIA